MTGSRTRFGLTWWGQRWIGALESLGAAYANRLPRGRTYARKGTVHDLLVAPGGVTAQVAGSRPRPYKVAIRLPVFTASQWETVTAALAGQIRHAAALLDGRMPEDVDDVLATCGLSFFPHARELSTTCSCPDAANPCKHVAAVHYVLAQAFDADPFLLPTLRGRDRAALLAALRGARTGVAADDAGHPDGEGVAFSALCAAALFDARGDLAATAVHPRAPADPAAALRRIGPPPVGDDRAEELIVRAAARAAERAWRLATEDEGPADPLVAELCSRGAATTQELSEALGEPAASVRDRLRTLVTAGVVHRTGHARGTRYHA